MTTTPLSEQKLVVGLIKTHFKTCNEETIHSQSLLWHSSGDAKAACLPAGFENSTVLEQQSKLIHSHIFV